MATPIGVYYACHRCSLSRRPAATSPGGARLRYLAWLHWRRRHYRPRWFLRLSFFILPHLVPKEHLHLGGDGAAFACSYSVQTIHKVV